MKKLEKKNGVKNIMAVSVYESESGKTNFAGGSCGGKSNTGGTCGSKSNNTQKGC